MLIMINLTGLKNVYLLPKVKKNNDGNGLWYYDLKFLFIQVCFFSQELGSCMVKSLNKGNI